jgi:hypothetical protein
MLFNEKKREAVHDVQRASWFRRGIPGTGAVQASRQSDRPIAKFAGGLANENATMQMIQIRLRLHDRLRKE